MYAAVLHAPGDIRVEEVPEPTPADGHALVRVDAVGVCGSDIPRILTKGAHRLPVIPGHEYSGTVVATNGVDMRVGQRVTVPPLIACFHCDPLPSRPVLAVSQLLVLRVARGWRLQPTGQRARHQPAAGPGDGG
jgi:threonine dehydrogenase-like Zn-dependent dehydrogenase